MVNGKQCAFERMPGERIALTRTVGPGMSSSRNARDDAASSVFVAACPTGFCAEKVPPQKPYVR